MCIGGSGVHLRWSIQPCTPSQVGYSCLVSRPLLVCSMKSLKVIATSGLPGVLSSSTHIYTFTPSPHSHTHIHLHTLPTLTHTYYTPSHPPHTHTLLCSLCTVDGVALEGPLICDMAIIEQAKNFTMSPMVPNTSLGFDIEKVLHLKQSTLRAHMLLLKLLNLSKYSHTYLGLF